MVENENIITQESQPGAAQRVSTYRQFGMKIYENNPVEAAIADIIINAEMLQQYGTDRSEFVIGLHRAAQQLEREVQEYLMS
jgi:hypothetical protein